MCMGVPPFHHHPFRQGLVRAYMSSDVFILLLFDQSVSLRSTLSRCCRQKWCNSDWEVLHNVFASLISSTTPLHCLLLLTHTF